MHTPQPVRQTQHRRVIVDVVLHEPSVATPAVQGTKERSEIRQQQHSATENTNKRAQNQIQTCEKGYAALSPTTLSGRRASGHIALVMTQHAKNTNLFCGQSKLELLGILRIFQGVTVQVSHFYPSDCVFETGGRKRLHGKRRNHQVNKLLEAT